VAGVSAERGALNAESCGRAALPLSRSAGVVTAFIAIAVGAGALAAVLHPPVVRFQPLGAGDLAHLVAPLCLLAVFVERVLEVFLTAWRGERAAQLKQLARRDDVAQASGPTPAQRLTAYQTQTQRMAFIGGTALGIALALAGVRVLQPLLDPVLLASHATPAWQHSAITVIDVLLTGTVLGGGSQGVHRVMRVAAGLVETTRKTA